jgi:hypothetical protein
MLSLQPESQSAQKNKREIPKAFLGGVIFALVTQAITWVAKRYSLNWWTHIGIAVGAGVVGGVLSAIGRRRRLRALPNWLLVEARIELVTPMGQMYRISYSYHINGEFYGSDIELSQNRWTIVPSDRLIGNMIQIRVNPRDFTQTFVLSRSLPGLSVEREWITADYSREME